MIRYAWPNPSGTFALSGPGASWNGSPSITTASIDGVMHTVVSGTGSFSLTSDTNVSITYTINGGAPITDQMTIFGQVQYAFEDEIFLNCEETTVIAIVVPISGTAGYAFSMGNSFPTISVASGAGSYTLTITDNSVCATANGATVPQVINFDILAWSGIEADIVSLTEPIPCPEGSLSGLVEIEPSAGTAPFTITWTPLTGDGEEGTDQTEFIVFEAGSYQVDFIDDDGCEDSDVIVIGFDDALTFSLNLININHIITSQGNVICVGSIEVEVTGSTEDFIFTIDPNESTYNYSNDTFEEIEVGDFYEVTATIDLPNSIGCSVSDTYEVESDAWAYSQYDMSGDGFIGFADVTIYNAQYSDCESTCNCTLSADVNDDGCVDYSDLVVLYTFWGLSLTCP